MKITRDNVSIRKNDESTGVVTIDGGGQNVIIIEGAKGIILDELKVERGNNGILASRSVSVSIIDST